MKRTDRAAAALISCAALAAVGLGSPAQAADNGKIAFLAQGQVALMDATTGAAVAYLGRTGAHFPAFAPDGSRIAVITSTGALTTFLPDGTGEVTVASGASKNFMRPAWSPDSSRLAYFASTPADDLSALVISNATAGAPRQTVTEVVGQLDGSIAWSPDGSTLLYSAPGGIWRVPASQGATPTEVNIAGPENRRDYGPSWSPDGSRFTFVRDCNTCDDLSQTGLWTAAVDGSSPQQLVSGPVQSPPAWSPDGKMIAFTMLGGANNSLHVITSTGTGQTALMTGPDFLAPSWGGAPVAPPPPATPSPTPAPAAPTLLTSPKVTGIAEYGKKMTASTGKWTGNPTTYMYQWWRCSVWTSKHRTCGPIDGATKAKYTIGQEDLGKKLYVKVMAANAQGRSIGSSAIETIPKPPKGKPVSVTFTILTMTRAGTIRVPVAVKGTQPIVSATVTIEEYGETVKALDDAKEKVSVPVDLNPAGRQKVLKRPVVKLTLVIHVVTKVHGKFFTSEQTVETKVTAQGR